MKVVLTLCLALCIGFLSAQNADLPKLSAAAQQYLWKQKQHSGTGHKILNECVYRMDAAGNKYLAAFVKVKPGFNESALKEHKIVVGSKSGNIWTAYVPLDEVEAFTAIQGIELIDIDRPIAPAMDSARVQTHIDSVHLGINLPQAFDGSNVVVGIIDAGFDYTHPAVFDTSYSHYRLKSVWEQKGTGTAPAAFGFGAEYSDSASIYNKGYDVLSFSHGTHVAGIAAGSGYGGPAGNNSVYRGAAYNSDLVYVGIMPDLNMWLNSGLTDMIDGINYVFDYATSAGKPAVANISWGNPIGPHDGNALFSQACDNTTGPGKILCLSAGNNGGKKVHLQKTFTATDTIVKTFLAFPAGLPSKTNWVDVWGDTAQSFCLKFSLYYWNPVPMPYTSSAVICLNNQTQQIALVGTNGDTCFITVTGVTNDYNGKPHMLVDIESRVPDDLLISVIGQSGTVDMWQGYVLEARGYYGAFSNNSLTMAANGDDVMSSSDMASTASALAVGAYTSRSSFTNSSGSTLSFGHTLYQITNFSSRGPSADGRFKPNIAAPGSAIASAVNSVDPAFLNNGSNFNLVMNQFVSPMNGNTYSYAVLQGTSMSSPLTAGVVALMLEANPGMNPYQVQTAIYNTAIKDAFTGNLSPANNIWGWGKLNAYGAVSASLSVVGVQDNPSPCLNGLVYPNPSKGIYTVELNSETDETVQITLYDVNAKLLKSIDWQVSEGMNRYQADWQELAQGVYFVKLKGKKGELNVKLLKQ